MPTAGCYSKVIAGSRQMSTEKEVRMLWTIAAILIVLWVLGLVSNASMGGLIHLLLVIAIVVVVLGFVRGRRL
jgi:fatty acid desaturase